MMGTKPSPATFCSPPPLSQKRAEPNYILRQDTINYRFTTQQTLTKPKEQCPTPENIPRRQVNLLECNKSGQRIARLLELSGFASRNQIYAT